MANDTIIENYQNENVPAFARVVLQNWHLVILILGMMSSIIFSWAHFQGVLGDLQSKVSGDEIQASAVAANVNAIAPQVSAMNAKLDIILKHDGL